MWASDGLSQSNNSNKMSTEELNRSRNRIGIDAKVQTESKPLFDLKGIPNEVRDSRLEKDISNYFKKLNNFRSSQDKIILNWSISPEKQQSLDQKNLLRRPSFGFKHEETDISTARSTSRKIHIKKGTSSTHLFNSRNNSISKR